MHLGYHSLGTDLGWFMMILFLGLLMMGFVYLVDLLVEESHARKERGVIDSGHLRQKT